MKTTAILCAVLMASAVVVAAPAHATPARAQASGTVLWEDQFNINGAPDSTKWGYQTGRWGAAAGEQQYYTSATSNVNVSGGSLNITARRETPPDAKPAPNNFTSARVVSMYKQTAKAPVRIEASIKMPSAQGLLPAFWTLGMEPGNEYSWPRQGEIDIVEIPGLNGPSFNVHGPAQNNPNQDIKGGSGIGPVASGYHTYRIDWLPDKITWYVDGVARFTGTKAQYEGIGGNWNPFSGAWPHYLLFNVAVGNNGVGQTPTSTPYPQTMNVDWVRVSTI
ncbi:glycoside hydrolase [Rhodococcus sp. 06-235-1A]|uniref:glycoside hydrolase family 16 protein n=1 Tax=Rhodococcus sp. 06-235-1A TaxID=2022508 RepID=UPI000B9AB5E2|nr:glycoside hydrolase family 16 protein [Rhodococcus sp. 06-235-1A]OZD08059.1 glycoside hydrolase [Rhodococcus sp. 06-235-1A]